MIGLINLIPVILFLTGAFFIYKNKTIKGRLIVTALTLATLFLYFQLQPSYGIKGEVKRTSIPAFEQKEYKVKDLQPKPMSGEDRDAKRKELYKEPLPFIEKSVDNK